MVEEELSADFSYDPVDLKRAIGEGNIKYEQLERKRIDILTSLNRVNAEMKKNRYKVEKLVEFKRQAEAKEERV